MEIFLFTLACVLYAAGFWPVLRGWRKRLEPSDRLPLPLIALGFAAHSMALGSIGQQLERCPISNLSQVLSFLSWSVALLYLVIGPSYRISLLGAFTAPLAAILLLLALLMPASLTGGQGAVAMDPWIEFHAAISLIAYGAFGLGCVAGIMYLIQDQQLKSGKPDSVFYRLPPITQLHSSMKRLWFAGFGLLTIGIGGGFIVGTPVELWGKIAWVAAVWAVYGVIIFLSMRSLVAPRREALLSIAGFTFTLSSLLGLRF